MSDSGAVVEVDVVEELGAAAYLYGRLLQGGTESLVTVRVDGRQPPRRGERVHVVPRADHVHLFGSDGARLAD